MDDDYRVRMEEDDLYPPLESLSEDFTHFEIIRVMVTEKEWSKMISTLRWSHSLKISTL